MPKCLNCSHDVLENYCPHCGQSIKTRKIDNKTIFVDVPFSLINIDSGFGFTFMQVLMRPVETAKKYIAGKKMNHFRPVSFLLVLTSFSYLISRLLPSNEIPEAIDKNGIDMNFAARLVTEFPQLVVLLSLPVLAFGQFVAFRNRKESFAVHFYYITYLQAFLTIVTFIPNIFLSTNIYYSIASIFFSSLAIILFYVFAYKNEQRIIVSVLRSILGLIYTGLVALIVAILAVAVVTFYFYLTK